MFTVLFMLCSVVLFAQNLPPALQNLVNTGKTKEEVYKIKDIKKLQELYDTQLVAYDATKTELRAMKKQGKEIKPPVKISNRITDLKIQKETEKVQKEKEKALEDRAITIATNKRYKEQAIKWTTPEMIEKLKKIIKMPGYGRPTNVAEKTHNDIIKTINQK